MTDVQHLRRIRFICAIVALEYILSDTALTGVHAQTEFCSRYISVNGYSCAEYQVTTTDGYVLNIQNIRSLVNGPQPFSLPPTSPPPSSPPPAVRPFSSAPHPPPPVTGVANQPPSRLPPPRSPNLVPSTQIYPASLTPIRRRPPHPAPQSPQRTYPLDPIVQQIFGPLFDVNSALSAVADALPQGGDLPQYDIPVSPPSPETAPFDDVAQNELSSGPNNASTAIESAYSQELVAGTNSDAHSRGAEPRNLFESLDGARSITREDAIADNPRHFFSRDIRTKYVDGRRPSSSAQKITTRRLLLQAPADANSTSVTGGAETAKVPADNRVEAGSLAPDSAKMSQPGTMNTFLVTPASPLHPSHPNHPSAETSTPIPNRLGPSLQSHRSIPPLPSTFLPLNSPPSAAPSPMIPPPVLPPTSPPFPSPLSPSPPPPPRPRSQSVASSQGSANDMRIPGGVSSVPSNESIRHPVLLEHAVFLGGEIWFLGDETSEKLPYLLADLGHDVWIAHHRGTLYSPDNNRYTRDQHEFWEYSFDELASIDLPLMVDLVLNQTKASMVHVVGYNQGGMLPLAIASEDSTFAKKIASIVSIGPIVFVGNITSPVLNEWGNGNTPDTRKSVTSCATLFYRLHLAQGLYNLTNTNNVNNILSVIGLNIGLLFGSSSPQNLIGNVTGPNCCVSATTQKSLGIGLDPSWIVSPYRNLVHYQQEVKSAQFQHWDYLSQAGNEREYGSSTPLKYKLSKIPPDLPIFLLTGDRDWIVDVKNVKKLVSSLPSRPQQLRLPNYAHFDLMFSDSVMRDVFRPILEWLHYKDYGDTSS